MSEVEVLPAGKSLAEQQYTSDEVMQASLRYFGGDELAASTFTGKYALRRTLDDGPRFAELTPDQMHDRLAREFARVESGYPNPRTERMFREAVDHFRYIVPQGSPMYGIGNPFVRVSISNCVVVESPRDNISGIMETGKDLANLFKRRCGVGVSLDSLRPDGAPVSNAAGTSTGAWSFADYFSHVCRMIGQNGRRGALMITMDVRHPDIERFTTMKRDLTKVTGANVSIMLTDEFMRCVEADADWTCRWPIHAPVEEARYTHTVKARDLWRLINESAVLCAEPGLLFWDNYRNNLPADCYPDFKTICVNPCVTADTWVMTTEGARRVEQLIGVPFTAVVDGEPFPSTGQGFFQTGQKPVIEVRTDRGFTLRATAEHPVLVEEQVRRCKPTRVWKQIRELCPGDRIVLHHHQDVNWSGEGSYQEGWLIGSLLGDGNIEKTGIANLDYWGNDRGGMLAHALRCIRDSVGGRSDMGGQEQPTHNRVRVCSAGVGRLARRFGMSYGDKSVTDRIEQGSSAFYRGFLSGWFDADGTVIGDHMKGVSVRLASTSREGLQVAQRMLARLGIISTIYPYRTRGGPRQMPDGRGGIREYFCQPMHELVITCSNLAVFEERVGFVTPEKRQTLRRHLSSFRRTINRESFLARVVELTPVGEEPVYDCTVPAADAFDANGCYVHNCSEIGLSAFDSCRLISVNLKNFVRNPYTPDAHFDFELFDQNTRLGMRMMDDMVDLEIEYLSRIIDHVDEPEEKVLWGKLRDAAVKGRRTGLGCHALGDTLACLGLRYDGDEALGMVDRIFQLFRDSAYDESVNLAMERGPFPAFDWETEKDCDFIRRLPQSLQDKIAKHGRRNISLLTMAPTGSVSIMSQTSSGIEPVFMNFYVRRKKINPSDPNARVDFVDQNGDRWEEFPVFHHNVMDYLNANPKAMTRWKEIEHTIEKNKWADAIAEMLPDTFVTSMEIDPRRRVEIQGVIQRYIDHGISSTINMPAGTTAQEGQELYEMAWKHGLKGVTIYVDGSRSGVLVSSGSAAASGEGAKAKAATAKAEPKVEPRTEKTEKPEPVLAKPPAAAAPPSFRSGIEPRPRKLTGTTYKIHTPVGEAYVTINDTVDGAFELFLNIAKAGSTVAADAEAIGRLCSLVLRMPGPYSRLEVVRQIVRQLEGIGGERSTGLGKQRVRSLADAVAQVLREHIGLSSGAEGYANGHGNGNGHSNGHGQEHDHVPAPEIEKPAVDAMLPVGDLCPSCGHASFIAEAGCHTCHSCGFSEC